MIDCIQVDFPRQFPKVSHDYFLPHPFQCVILSFDTKQFKVLRALSNYRQIKIQDDLLDYVTGHYKKITSMVTDDEYYFEIQQKCCF